MKRLAYILLAIFCLCSCNKKSKITTLSPAPFDADSAYSYVADQVFFGPRVPGTMPHAVCAKYIEAQLQRFGAMIEVEKGEMTDFQDNTQPVYNITGRFLPGTNNRILLCAHWDCRPWADEDPDYIVRQTTAVMGANDGASGVGVLLEIARQLGKMQADSTLKQGVDIIFFDTEDMGTPSFYTGKEKENTWCLGSQLWSKERGSKLKTLYRYGILLDMVGAHNAIFPKESVSMYFAPNIVNKLWKNASLLGYSSYFIDTEGSPITDDHYYVNTLAGIPCVDIIHYETQGEHSFFPEWHTTADNMRNINHETLDAVGKTVLTTVLQ